MHGAARWCRGLFDFYPTYIPHAEGIALESRTASSGSLWRCPLSPAGSVTWEDLDALAVNHGYL
jgi:hypothetical protein